MGSVKIKDFLKFGIFYLAGFAVVLGIKLFYSNAGSDELLWILAPTAWWARALSGIAFEYQPHVGYVSHACRFVIASSCSGVQFMTVSFATLIFSYVHRMKTAKKGLCWLALCLVNSYLITVFVNGIRIVISIYLPMAASVHGLAGRLGPERLHTVIGIAIYFTSLFIIYQIAGWLSGKIGAWECKGCGLPEAVRGEDACSFDGPALHGKVISWNSNAYGWRGLHGKVNSGAPRNTSPLGRRALRGRVYKCAPPIFWYFFIVLGIPFMNGAFQNNPKSFVEYAALMTVVCFAIVSVYCLLSLFKTRHSSEQEG